jgi:DNA-3-methyladenine glycosylase II
MKKALTHLKKSDPVLGGIIRSVGPYAMEYREPVFDSLVRSIVFQQVSGNVARVIYGRLRTALADNVTPQSVLRLRPQRMRKLGLSTAKTAYIRDLARLTADGTVDFASLPGAADDEIIATLTQVKGIGVWTAQMFLIFALARPDVLPTGDLGIRKAMQIAYKLEELPKPHKMEELAAPWRPYCSVASWYLWRSLDGIAGI